MNLSELLSLSIKEGASDLHLSAGLSLILQIDGDLVQTDLRIMNADLYDKLWIQPVELMWPVPMLYYCKDRLQRS